MPGALVRRRDAATLAGVLLELAAGHDDLRARGAGFAAVA